MLLNILRKVAKSFTCKFLALYIKNRNIQLDKNKKYKNFKAKK